MYVSYRRSTCVGSLWEVWIVMIHAELDGHLFSSAAGVTGTDRSATLDEELCFVLSTAARRLQALQLTETETTILKAFILFAGMKTGAIGN